MQSKWKQVDVSQETAHKRNTKVQLISACGTAAAVSGLNTSLAQARQAIWQEAKRLLSPSTAQRGRTTCTPA